MSAPNIIVIDYGVGNLLSVRRGLEYCGAIVTMTSDADQILGAQRVVLPGVGAFGNGMEALNALQLVPVLREVAERGTPFLGICLGMQLLLDQSQEFGVTEGLGLIPGQVKAIPEYSTDGIPLKIPHIGWNSLVPAEQADWRGTPLSDTRSGDTTYFVHSFMATPNDDGHRLADCLYGGHRIAAVIRRDNITGCQFHPEKSGEVGLKVLKRFCSD